jgi:hypothetical protein
VTCGDAKRPGHAGLGPRKSPLFFLTRRQSASGIALRSEAPDSRGKAGFGFAWCSSVRGGTARAGPGRERRARPVKSPAQAPVSSHTNQELSGKARLETAREPSQAHGAFRPVRRRSYPRGFWLLLCRPERSRGSRRANPAKRPHSPYERGAQGSSGGGERADLAKSVKPPQWGGHAKRDHPAAKAKAT